MRSRSSAGNLGYGRAFDFRTGKSNSARGCVDTLCLAVVVCVVCVGLLFTTLYTLINHKRNKKTKVNEMYHGVGAHRKGSRIKEGKE